jgi:outer membrane receptor protein involved in Fe transport
LNEYKDACMIERYPLRKVLLTFLVLIAVSYTSSFASNAGKVAGVVVDSDGRPIPSANVVILNSHAGGATDLDGRYFIIGLPPGRHDIQFTALGFRTKIVADVQVRSNYTTRVNVTLEAESLELDAVTIVFEKPPVDLEETGQRISVTGDFVRNMPLQRADEILPFQAGVSSDADGDLHIRGGRTGEVGYIVDGMRVENTLYGGGNTTIDRHSLQELQLLSGTFNAEYGQAMSGIVQVVTRGGDDKYKVHVDYESPRLNDSRYRERDWVRTDSDAVQNPNTGESEYNSTDVTETNDLLIPMTGRLGMTLSGPVPALPRTTFFVSGLHEADDSHLPFGDRWLRQISGKLTNSLNVGKLAISFGWRKNDSQDYSHAWKYVPEQYHRKFDTSNRISTTYSANLTKALYLEILSGYNRLDRDRKIFEDWQDYLSSDYSPADFTFAQYFYDEDDWSDIWRESRTETFNNWAKLTWQSNPIHLWTTGLEFTSKRMDIEDIRDLHISPNGEREGVVDRFEQNPVEFAAFVQDKIELDYLVVNAGLRFDYVDAGSEGWKNPENPRRKLKPVDASTQLSPRLGLAHPISSEWTLHFAYGHFFQFPNYINLYMNSADLNPDTLANRSFDTVGNPALKPERTVAYEVGLKGVIAEDWGVSATAFYKDITDLVGSRQVRVGTSYNFAPFINIDYANVKGFEVNVNRNFTRYWSMQANYTFSIAKGNSSEPTAGYWDAYQGIPEARQEYAMDFDRRHVTNALLAWTAGPDNYPRVFGSSILSGVSVGFIGQFASGLPYTPYSEVGEQLSIRNSERMDYTATMDLRLSKRFQQSVFQFTVYTTIANVFDRENPLFVDSRTGQPWESTLISNDIAFDQLHDPSRVAEPRTIKAGVEVSF